MEHFIDGQFVWLRSLMGGVYLHADEDGRRVSVRANRASRNAAWRVQVYYPGGIIILLQGAAYGRYLAATEAPAPRGYCGFRAEQRDFDDPEALSMRWQAVRASWGHGIMIIHISCRSLRSNGYQRRWESGVTIDDMDNLSVMMYWVVQPIPRRYTIPRLPGPRQLFGYVALSLGRNVEEDRWRLVRYVHAGPDGLVDENDWATAFPFSGRSVFNLRSALALLLGEAVVFTMCVRAGQYARLTPLVVDLPISSDLLDIVILMDGSPAIQALRHPNVDAA